MVSEILSRQAWYVSPRIYKSSTYTTELWTRLLECLNGTLDIFLKNLIAGLYPFGMHVTSNKSSKINLREFWWVRCICTDELLLVTQSNFCNVSLNGNYLAIWEEI